MAEVRYRLYRGTAVPGWGIPTVLATVKEFEDGTGTDAEWAIIRQASAGAFTLVGFYRHIRAVNEPQALPVDGAAIDPVEFAFEWATEAARNIVWAAGSADEPPTFTRRQPEFLRLMRAWGMSDELLTDLSRHFADRVLDRHLWQLKNIPIGSGGTA